MRKNDVKKLIETSVPTNWLHPLMTGDRSILKENDYPHYNRDIERLCLAIKKELLDNLEKFGKQKDGE